MTADELIKDCVKRIAIGLEEGRFSLHQLKLLESVFRIAMEATRKTIAKAEQKKAGG